MISKFWHKFRVYFQKIPNSWKYIEASNFCVRKIRRLALLCDWWRMIGNGTALQLQFGIVRTMNSSKFYLVVIFQFLARYDITVDRTGDLQYKKESNIYALFQGLQLIYFPIVYLVQDICIWGLKSFLLEMNFFLFNYQQTSWNLAHNSKEMR